MDGELKPALYGPRQARERARAALVRDYARALMACGVERGLMNKPSGDLTAEYTVSHE